MSEQRTVSNRTTSVVLADDHTVVRRALRMLLESEEDFDVVGEAGTAAEAVRYCRGHAPDILVLDLNMPEESGLKAIPQIQEVSPETGIVVLTMQDDPAFAREALQAGVLGYVLKEAADDELVNAIRMAAEGRTYLQPELGARLASEPEATGELLSERELEILRLIALGHTNSEVADKLFLSVRTVESHRAHLQQKLRLTKRSELVRYALEQSALEG
jgi:two-component system, NarL family, response regulator NreC